MTVGPSLLSPIEHTEGLPGYRVRPDEESSLSKHFLSGVPLAIHQPLFPIPENRSFSRGAIHKDHGVLTGRTRFDGHRGDIHSFLSKRGERELSQLISPNLADILCSHTQRLRATMAVATWLLPVLRT